MLKLFPVWTLRRMGMEIGDNCYIDRHIFIPSEPYLIKVGNNVGITSGVHLHTHGGARVLYDKVPDYGAFGKITIEDLAYIGSGAQIMPGVTIGEGSHCDKIRPETHCRRRQSRPCHLHGRRILRKKPEIQHAQQRHGLRPEKEIAALSSRRQVHEEKIHATLIRIQDAAASANKLDKIKTIKIQTK